MPDHAASINFDRLAAIYEETRGGLKRGGSYARTIGPRLRSGTVLEIGVGTASVALPLTDAGHPVVGVDLSANMLALAHERLGARVAIADVMTLPIADASVPNVLAVWVLQLVGSVDAALREARRVLSPGGRLIVITSRGRADPDDIEEASVDFQTVLRGRRQDDSDIVIAHAERRACVSSNDSTLKSKRSTRHPPPLPTGSKDVATASSSTSLTMIGRGSWCP